MTSKEMLAGYQLVDVESEERAHRDRGQDLLVLGPGPPHSEHGRISAAAARWVGADAGDGDEIRVIRSVGGSVVADGIAYHGNGGERWLREQDARWTADGYERILS